MAHSDAGLSGRNVLAEAVKSQNNLLKILELLNNFPILANRCIKRCSALEYFEQIKKLCRYKKEFPCFCSPF